jgi:hypothetical protein
VTDLEAFQGKVSPTFFCSGRRGNVGAASIELHLQGKQAHWSVVGTNSRDAEIREPQDLAVSVAFHGRVVASQERQQQLGWGDPE